MHFCSTKNNYNMASIPKCYGGGGGGGGGGGEDIYRVHTQYSGTSDIRIL